VGTRVRTLAKCCENLYIGARPGASSHQWPYRQQDGVPLNITGDPQGPRTPCAAPLDVPISTHPWQILGQRNGDFGVPTETRNRLVVYQGTRLGFNTGPNAHHPNFTICIRCCIMALEDYHPTFWRANRMLPLCFDCSAARMRSADHVPVCVQEINSPTSDSMATTFRTTLPVHGLHSCNAGSKV
jgi:hypothetical protein